VRFRCNHASIEGYSGEKKKMESLGREDRMRGQKANGVEGDDTHQKEGMEKRNG